MDKRATLQKYINKRRDSSKMCIEGKRLHETGLKELKTGHHKRKKYALVVQPKNIFIPVKTRFFPR
jgi:hypothetical protein